MTNNQPYQVAPPQRPAASGLDIAALVLAILLPVVGLVLALVARSSARKQGRPVSGVATAALIVSCVLTGLGLLALIVSVVIISFTFAQLSAVTAPPGVTPIADSQASSEVIVQAAWADGAHLSRDALASAETVIAARLASADIDGWGLSVVDDRIRVTFDEKAEESAIDRAVEALDGELRLDFRPVLATAACDSRPAEADQGPGHQLVVCDPDGVEEFTLGPSEVDGGWLTSVSAVELQRGSVSTAEWAVLMSFSTQGASAFADLTERLAAEPIANRVAIVLDGRVLSAPTVQSPILDGQLQIAGGFDQQAAQSLATQVELAAGGLQLRVESVTRLK